jgi:hypothetical protein
LGRRTTAGLYALAAAIFAAASVVWVSDLTLASFLRRGHPVGIGMAF